MKTEKREEGDEELSTVAVDCKVMVQPTLLCSVKFNKPEASEFYHMRCGQDYLKKKKQFPRVRSNLTAILLKNEITIWSALERGIGRGINTLYTGNIENSPLQLFNL